MRTIARFGGILGTLAIMIGLFVLGFAGSYPGLLFVSLACVWPFLWAITAWTVRGLRENYQLVPKSALSPRIRQQPVKQDF